MKSRNASAISIVTNIVLTGLKLLVGSLTMSMTLIADGLHSGLDILSSVITYLSIKESHKPADEDHPYGHEKFESLASFSIVIILSLSAFLILIESLESLISGETLTEMNIYGLLVVFASGIINFFLMKLKINVGEKNSSAALIADGKHSKADSLSSFGLILGLVLIYYYPVADSVIAILVSGFIFFESYKLGVESISPLVDGTDYKLKKELKAFLKDENIKYSKIKTRKSAGKSFAEIHIKPDPNDKVKKVLNKTEDLKKELKNKKENLKEIIFIIN